MLIENRSESAFLNIIILTLAFMLFISVHLPPPSQMARQNFVTEDKSEKCIRKLHQKSKTK